MDKKLIVLGTSHVHDIHGTFKENINHPDYVKGHYAETNSERWTAHLENKLNEREDETWTVENCGIGGHGISTYHHRIMNCLEQAPDIDLTFLIEIPCGNRLTVTYRDVQNDYNHPLSQLKKYRPKYYQFFDTFLRKDYFNVNQTQGEFWDHSLPINMEIYDKDFWKIMSEKFKRREMKLSPSFKEDYIGFQNVMNSLEKKVPEEEILLYCMSIHGYLTNLGYNVCWFNLDYDTPTHPSLKNKKVADFLKVIPYKTPLNKTIAKQFNKGKEIKLNPKLCFDGVHPNKEIWHWLVENYFIKLL